MDDNHEGEITRLLAELGGGNAEAAEELVPLVYNQLRKLAQIHLAREVKGQLPQPTELVHEAYLRLVKNQPLQFENRRHFFSAAGEAMRRILIERARKAARRRHGSDLKRVSLEEKVPSSSAPRVEELLALDQALTRLESRDSMMGDVVKLRFFVGMTVEETAEALGISPRSVNRFWTGARAWLQREISGPHPSGSA